MLTTPARIITATFAAVALAGPPALALAADPPAPQTRDLAAGTGTLTLAPDQRSPDARVDDVRVAPMTIAQDQRSADARDAGSARPVVVAVDAPVTSGFDWTDALIGAAGALAIAMIAGAGIALLRRRSPQPVV